MISPLGAILDQTLASVLKLEMNSVFDWNQ